MRLSFWFGGDKRLVLSFATEDMSVLVFSVVMMFWRIEVKAEGLGWVDNAN